MVEFKKSVNIIQESSGHNVLLHWQAPEFEKYKKDKKWYFWASVALVAILIHALWTNSPVMAITFILIGVVGYILINREPRIIDFMITTEGVVAGREIYDFENIKSFWIFYEPGELTVISLHTEGMLLPFVHIPIQDENPVEIREILLKYVPEIRQEPSLVDTFERILGI